MRTINIGGQRFDNLRMNHYFYIDKTSFIKEWWENGDDVTLITRPRRFGKTLNMDMLNCFFSNRYAGRSDLFEGLDIWKEEKYKELQGTYPVISLSFARIKRTNVSEAKFAICNLLSQICGQHTELLSSEKLEDFEKEKFRRYCTFIEEKEAPDVLNYLSSYLYKHYGKKVLIFLDEYDTPLQEAYIHGYWDEMVSFIRGLFNSTFKSNDFLDRALLTGITRVSKESIFSDMNNLEVVTTTSQKYETSFGFAEKNVFDALEEYNLSDQREEVKKWYDGFTFGNVPSIYNPWSVLKYLETKGEYAPYWANTSSNGLINYELQHSDNDIKQQMAVLMNDGSIQTVIDEEIIFNQLETNSKAIWSLFLASGYLKVAGRKFNGKRYEYILSLTNFEVHLMFEDMIMGWFENTGDDFNDFMKALVSGSGESVQEYLSHIFVNNVGFFDTEKEVSENQKPESFYHGLVLGMIVLQDRYHVTSNRESGYGRYDIQMMPKEKTLPGIIIEFKIFEPKKEKTLEDTADRALQQIKERNYDAELISNGITFINHYGMGFSGKDVVVHKG